MALQSGVATIWVPFRKLASKLNRTTASGKVSLIASTGTYIRLANNLLFWDLGRAH